MSADGTWNITMKTPMGAQDGTLDLATDGGTLTGSMTASVAPEPIEITDGSADGDALSWKAALTQPMPITLEFTATVAGDAITGTVKLGGLRRRHLRGQQGLSRHRPDPDPRVLSLSVIEGHATQAKFVG
jgi:hypothetical protein